MLPATSALDLEKEFKKFMEIRMAAQAEVESKKKGKGAKKMKKKTPLECKVGPSGVSCNQIVLIVGQDERLKICREIIAQHNEVPKNTIEVKSASVTTKKRKDTDTDEQWSVFECLSHYEH